MLSRGGRSGSRNVEAKIKAAARARTDTAKSDVPLRLLNNGSISLRRLSVLKAAKMADAGGVVSTFPGGYDTVLWFAAGYF